MHINEKRDSIRKNRIKQSERDTKKKREEYQNGTGNAQYIFVSIQKQVIKPKWQESTDCVSVLAVFVAGERIDQAVKCIQRT